MITSSSEIRVRYAETDKMGVVYHSNYFIWFEVARVKMLDELGCPYTTLEERGFLLPVMEASSKYLRPARFDDRVIIHLKIQKIPSVRFRVDYELTIEETIIAQAHTVHAFMSPDGRAIRPPQDLLELMKPYYQ